CRPAMESVAAGEGRSPTRLIKSRGYLSMPTCEKCQMRDARVRLDGIVNGRRESHLFCQECAEELMRGAMDPMDGAMGGALGGIFGRANGSGSAGIGTATAERQGPQSKTPVLDHFG